METKLILHRESKAKLLKQSKRMLWVQQLKIFLGVVPTRFVAHDSPSWLLLVLLRKASSPFLDNIFGCILINHQSGCRVQASSEELENKHDARYTWSCWCGVKLIYQVTLMLQELNGETTLVLDDLFEG